MADRDYSITFHAGRYFENDEVAYTDETAQEEFGNLIGQGFDDVINEESDARIDRESGHVEGYDVVLKVEYRGALKPTSALPDSPDGIALAMLSDFFNECGSDVLLEIESIEKLRLEFEDEGIDYVYKLERVIRPA